MNNILQKGLSQMESMLPIQFQYARDTDRANDSSADYHNGMYNGMMLGYSVFSNTSPAFRCRSDKIHKRNRVRHRKHK